MLVKICGITNLEDAWLALEDGADALGFNFYPASPRYVDRPEAEAIIEELPRGWLKVGVYVGWPESIPAWMDVLQVHGLRDNSAIGVTKRRVWVATAPAQVHLFPHREIVIDCSWGTGRKADWKELTGLGRPFILSGGLTPENVRQAIERLKPVGVDVCSGVESQPGRKDPVRLREFIREAKRAGQSL